MTRSRSIVFRAYAFAAALATCAVGCGAPSARESRSAETLAPVWFQDVTEVSGLRLLLNNGNGTFTDATKEAGLDSTLWGTSAAFFDYDRDGWLDLVVVNYVDYDPVKPCYEGNGRRRYCAPAAFRYAVAKLYRNRGPHGTKGSRISFEDVTAKSGPGRLP